VFEALGIQYAQFWLTYETLNKWLAVNKRSRSNRDYMLWDSTQAEQVKCILLSEGQYIVRNMAFVKYLVSRVPMLVEVNIQQ
jgi:hypothetical protein